MIFLTRNFIISICLLTLSSSLWASDKGLRTCRFSCGSLPESENRLQYFGKWSQKSLPPHFNFLVWNTFKGALPAWTYEIKKLLAHYDLVLLQEVVTEDFYLKALQDSGPGLSWVYSPSWYFRHNSNHSTGVANAALAPAVGQWSFQSPNVEPVFATPKMSLVTEYRIQGKPYTLMVANIHGINYNYKVHSALRNQVRQVLQHLKTHRGPIIFAGDFNTWMPSRLRLVDKELSAIGLKRVQATNITVSPVLDHIYVRGLRVHQAEMLSTLLGSDHFPIRAEFSVID